MKTSCRRLALSGLPELGLALVVPDTSPRGRRVWPTTKQEPMTGVWGRLLCERHAGAMAASLPDVRLRRARTARPDRVSFPVSDPRSISGHSMGGHGALSIGFKNPRRYRSISAFSPITDPMRCPWGEKAFAAYLGTDQSWEAYDSCALIRQTAGEDRVPILIDQGEDDEFLSEQLHPDLSYKRPRCRLSNRSAHAGRL